MGNTTLGVTFKNASSYITAGSNYTLMSPAEFRDLYLWGLPLCNPYTGQTISDSILSQKIAAAQGLVERSLDLKMLLQFVVETKDFDRDVFMAWGFLRASYFIRYICQLTGQFNQLPIIDYPTAWLTIKSTNDLPSNNLAIVPNGSQGIAFSYYAVAYPNLFGFWGMGRIPNYWRIRYVTGWAATDLPQELIEFVGLCASLWVLPILEMTVTGLGGTAFGMASQSMSIDGLAQSASKINGGNVFQQRMKSAGTQLALLYTQMRNYYSGFKFDVL